MMLVAFFFLEFALAIQGFLQFHTNFGRENISIDRYLSVALSISTYLSSQLAIIISLSRERWGEKERKKPNSTFYKAPASLRMSPHRRYRAFITQSCLKGPLFHAVITTIKFQHGFGRGQTNYSMYFLLFNMKIQVFSLFFFFIGLSQDLR